MLIFHLGVEFGRLGHRRLGGHVDLRVNRGILSLVEVSLGASCKMIINFRTSI